MYAKGGVLFQNTGIDSTPSEIERERFDKMRIEEIFDWIRRIECGGHYRFSEIKAPYIIAQIRWLAGYCNRLSAKVAELRDMLGYKQA